MKSHERNLVMGVDFIERKDNLLNKDDCKQIIEWVFNNKKIIPDENIRDSGYHYCDIGIDEILNVPELKKLNMSIINLKQSYVKKYPEVNNTFNAWDISYIRFKWWKSNCAYSIWHSDNGGKCIQDFKRIISFLIYLSDNDCYTEFRRHRNAKTKLGSGIMFPTFFTHEHRGGICKKGLDRFVISGYISYV